MLGRYTMYRGSRPAGDPLPEGLRQDTRKHTRHCLRPQAQMVEQYLKDPTDPAWVRYQRQYLRLLEKRFTEDRKPFDQLAEQARTQHVHLGCSCPTKQNPDPAHCHTVAALAFMHGHYPDLVVMLPPGLTFPSPGATSGDRIMSRAQTVTAASDQDDPQREKHEQALADGLKQIRPELARWNRGGMEIWCVCRRPPEVARHGAAEWGIAPPRRRAACMPISRTAYAAECRAPHISA